MSCACRSTVIFCLFTGLVSWAPTMKIAGAVVASCTVVVESNAKSVVHGDISRIFIFRAGRRARADVCY